MGASDFRMSWWVKAVVKVGVRWKPVGQVRMLKIGGWVGGEAIREEGAEDGVREGNGVGVMVEVSTVVRWGRNLKRMILREEVSAEK